MARSIAIFLMVIENYKNAMEAHNNGPGWLVWFFNHIEGRGSAGLRDDHGRGRAAAHKVQQSGDAAFKRDTTMVVVKRGLFLLALGVLNYQIWPGDILHFYGFYMVIRTAAFHAFLDHTGRGGGGDGDRLHHQPGLRRQDRVGIRALLVQGLLDAQRLCPQHVSERVSSHLPLDRLCDGRHVAGPPPDIRPRRAAAYPLIFLPLTALLECAMSYPSFVHVLHNPHTGVAFVDGLLRVLESRPDALNMLAARWSPSP